MNEESIKYLIARLLDSAKETVEDSKDNVGDAFYEGKRLAYYEMLSILQVDLDIQGEELKKYGLNVDLLKDLAL